MTVKKLLPATGEIWFIQLDRGCLVLAVEIDEVTAKTCVLRVMADASTKPEAVGMVRRFRTSDVTFLERVTDWEPAACESVPELLDTITLRRLEDQRATPEPLTSEAVRRFMERLFPNATPPYFGDA